MIVNCKPRLLLITDHQFWLRDRGDRQRISSVIYHLSSYCCVDILYLAKEQLSLDIRAELKVNYKINHLYSYPLDVLWSNSIFYLMVMLGKSKSIWPVKLFYSILFKASRHGVIINKLVRYLSFSNLIRSCYLQLIKCMSWIWVWNNPNPVIDYDVIMVEYLRLSSFAQSLKKIYPRSRYLIDTHDVLHLRQASFLRYNQSTGHSITEEMEKRELDFFDVILGISVNDCREFARLQPNKVIIHVGHPMQLPIRKESTTKTPVSAPKDHVLIFFLGTAGQANIDAVEVLILEILPVLKRLARQKFALHIAGAVCNSPQIKFLSSQFDDIDLVWHGILSRESNHYKNVDIVCNPVRFGGGLKIKNIEAISNQCVLVTTTEGAKGLPFYDQPYYICSDNPTVLAQGMSQLINSPSLLSTYRARTASVAGANLNPNRVYKELDDYIMKASALSSSPE